MKYTCLLEFDKNPSREWVVGKKEKNKYNYKLLIGILNYDLFDNKIYKIEKLHYQNYSIVDLNAIDILLLSYIHIFLIIL